MQLRVIIFLLIGFHGSRSFPPNDRKQGVCQTKACQEIAASFVASMDKSVQPCDNFYNFVCGNWTKNLHEVPKYDIYHVDEVPNEISNSVTNELQYVTDSQESFWLLKQYYDMCKNEEPLTKDKLMEMLNGLGGWPLIAGPSWAEANFDLIDAIHKFRKFGYEANYFFNFDKIRDPKNESRTILEIQPTWDLRKKYESYNFDTQKFDASLEQFISVDLEYLNFNTTEISTTLDFTRTLTTELLPMYNANVEVSSKMMTVEDLNNEFSTFPWQKYLRKMLFNRVDAHKIDQILVYYPDYMKKVIDLIDKTPKRILANYIFWMLFADLRRDLAFSPNKGSQGTPRIKQFDCWKKINHKLAPALNIFFIYYTFPNFHEVNPKLTSMSMNVKQTFHQLINDAKWLDKKTKDKSLKKLNDIKFESPFNSRFLNTTRLDKFYHSSVSTIRNRHWVKKITEVDGILLEESFSHVYSYADDEPETVLTREVDFPNAFYNIDHNTVEILATIVKNSNYGPQTPRYLDYGRLGFILGHEITHGFDNDDELFEPGTNTPSVQYFHEETKCISDQYDKFEDKESKLKVNGTRTVLENIADNAGLKASYHAYSKVSVSDTRLPGLEEYSTKQMFWLSFAHSHCVKYGSYQLQHIFDNTDHTVEEFRILGTLQNRPEFSQDFKCKDGSYMKPAKRCGIW